VEEQSLTSCSAPVSYFLYFIYLLTYPSFLSAPKVGKLWQMCSCMVLPKRNW